MIISPRHVTNRWTESFRHLRPLRSLHLAPVTLFALAEAAVWPVYAVCIVGILHTLVYPSSAGFNSFHDRDEVSTGGLRIPPPVHHELLFLVTLLDVLAVFFAYQVNATFAAAIFAFVVAQRLYSHRAIRIKRFPIIGWLWVMFFQGAFMFLACRVASGTGDFSVGLDASGSSILPPLFCSLLVSGAFPLSQIYQFEEDAKRGDVTIAMRLGYRGTFVLSFVCLGGATLALVSYFVLQGDVAFALLAGVFFSAPAFQLFDWFRRVEQDFTEASHDRAMRFSNTCTLWGNGFFIVLLLWRHI